MTSARDCLATVFFVGWMSGIYLIFGMHVLAGAFLGVTCMYVTVGIAFYYWIGSGRDWHVIQLMKYLNSTQD
jgi:polyferredoxin